MAFLMYNLSRNPEKQQKLREEINKILPNKNTPITPEILNELRYMKACVKESMR